MQVNAVHHDYTEIGLGLLAVSAGIGLLTLRSPRCWGWPYTQEPCRRILLRLGVLGLLTLWRLVDAGAADGDAPLKLRLTLTLGRGRRLFHGPWCLSLRPWRLRLRGVRVRNHSLNGFYKPHLGRIRLQCAHVSASVSVVPCI